MNQGQMFTLYEDELDLIFRCLRNRFSTMTPKDLKLTMKLIDRLNTEASWIDESSESMEHVCPICNGWTSGSHELMCSCKPEQATFLEPEGYDTIFADELLKERIMVNIRVSWDDPSGVNCLLEVTDADVPKSELKGLTQILMRKDNARIMATRGGVGHNDGGYEL